jgi:hypothetical protein
MKNSSLLMMFLILFTMLITGCNVSDPKPKLMIIGGVVSNLENVKYLRINTDTVITTNKETHEFFQLSEIDYVNDKLQVHAFDKTYNEEIGREYYIDGNMTYIDANGTWFKEERNKNVKLGNFLTIDRFGKAQSTLSYVQTQKLNYVDSYIYTSQISEAEAQKKLNDLFKGAITDQNGKSVTEFIIKDAHTEWWINKENLQLSMDIQTIDAEMIEGYPIKVIIQNSYGNYNEPLNITIPKTD